MQHTVKPVDNDEFKLKQWDMKSKQREYYDQQTKEQKTLLTREKVQMFRDGKWKPALLKS